MTMLVVPPLSLTGAMIVSNAPESTVAGEVEWRADAPYAAGKVVYRSSLHRRFECLAAGAGIAGVIPEDNPLKWLDRGPTNLGGMFDLQRGTATTCSSPLTVTLSPGTRVDAIGLVGLQATSITVTVTNNGSQIYSVSESLDRRVVQNWYDYFFAPFVYAPSWARFDLPPSSSAQITITLTNNPGVPVSCDGLVVGMKVGLGELQIGADSDRLSFAKIERDNEGVAKVTPGRNVPANGHPTKFDKRDIGRVTQVRDQLAGARVALWAGLDDDHYELFDAFLICGFYRSFKIIKSDQTDWLSANIQLEEI